MQKQFLLPQDFSGKRADIIFSEIFKQHSRSLIRKFIKNGHIKVDSRAIKPSKILSGGESVSYSFPRPEPIEALPEDIKLDVISENEDFIVVNKPAGMVVHSGAGVNKGTLVNALLFHCTDLSGIGGKIRPGIVHRLDKETSGVMVVAKNDFTHTDLVNQFKRRDVKKSYLAIVHGNLKKNEGTFSGVIGRHRTSRIKMSSNTNSGKEAVTEWKVKKRYEAITFVEACPKTGRTHQIRVHFSENGHPLLTDRLYGNTGKDRDFFHNKGNTIKRHALHAHKLGFKDPRSGKLLEFTAELPDDFKDTLKIANN